MYVRAECWGAGDGAPAHLSDGHLLSHVRRGHRSLPERHREAFVSAVQNLRVLSNCYCEGQAIQGSWGGCSVVVLVV